MRKISIIFAMAFRRINLALKQSPVVVFLLCACCAMRVNAQNNPIIRDARTADPEAHVWADGKLWIYTSGDNPTATSYSTMDGYRVYSTTDMVNYVSHGVILKSSDLSWGVPGYMFAPTVAYKNGKYYLIFPHSTSNNYNMTCGVAVSDVPQGPFKELGIIKGVSGQWLDPCVFTDTDGKTYLYWGVYSPKVARLKDNMTELAENPRDVVYGSNNFFEAAFMHKKGNTYYFSYNIKGGGHYATGTSPYGPFKYVGAVNPSQGQDHHSIVEFKGQWYFFYHVQNWNGGTQFRRNVCVEYLYYNSDGTMKPVYPTPAGVGPISNEATLTKSGSGAASQTLYAGTAITSFTYTWANATSVTVTDLPAGVTSAINTTNKTVTISGTPTTAGTNNYTITTTGGSPNATATGTITVTATPKPTDCAGVENGTATIDNCGRCIGGTTDKVACTTAGEAEVDACSFDGTVDNNNLGFKGTGFINVPNAIGSEITFHVNATTAGTKTLSFRYASGGTANRAATVNINGTALATSLSFPATGAFTTYKTVEINLALNEGVNVVQLVSTTADGLANIDQIGYVSAGLSKGDCEAVVTSVNKGSEAYSLELYPNPSQSNFHIKTSAPLNIEITDAEGKTLKTYSNVSELEFGADLLPGIYFAKVQNKVYKFVKY